MPNIDMITEAGIIGKIGLNSAAVGVCLNATRAEGVDFSKFPCHLALRKCLNSNSRAEAVETLRSAGVASSCHILVADPQGGTGIECSSVDTILLQMCQRGTVMHTNHFVEEHRGVKENVLLKDSEARLARIGELVKVAEPDFASIRQLLQDEDGYPYLSTVNEHLKAQLQHFSA